MLSKIIIAPFLICSIVFLYLSLNVNDKYSWYIVPNFVAVAIIYILSPQIDWWWYQRRPPKLPDGLVKMFAARMSFFRKLIPADKTKFCNRVALYKEANEFIPKGMESVPLDIQAVIAASAVQLTLGQEDYLLNKFEHIVVYPHPFPSPQYNQWHVCEIFQEDGVIMFSAKQLMAGFAQPQKYFHIGLYEYTKVFKRCHPAVEFPTFGEEAWQKLEQVSKFPKGAIEKWIGLTDLDVEAVATAHFFVFPKRFKEVMPVEFNGLAKVFNQKPV